MGMIDRAKFFIAFGEIDPDTLFKLIKKRARHIEGNKKEIIVPIDEIVKGVMAGKRLSEFGLKEFFRLHPPLKGINSKLPYPKGVLGNNKKDINKLIERML